MPDHRRSHYGDCAFHELPLLSFPSFLTFTFPHPRQQLVGSFEDLSFLRLWFDPPDPRSPLHPRPPLELINEIIGCKYAYVVDLGELGSFWRSVGAGVVIRGSYRLGSSLVLSRCQELCELELFALALNGSEIYFISPIIPGTIEKLLLARSNAIGSQRLYLPENFHSVDRAIAE